MSENNDELIKAQNELIGILFEIIKRLQSNNDLDAEYFQIISKDSRSETEKFRLDKITKERKDNAKIVSRLLKQIESN
ncbi:hydrolase [Candidatus Nitrosopelagicus sp.]|nr:hydrolase [Candidatus Nitrosopelagicus sp.]|tara:strand:+ start:495 stop:728 length:234 start_codon:yes stop_codon:yes gene_type:complete